jgi:hypothetical protein
LHQCTCGALVQLLVRDNADRFARIVLVFYDAWSQESWARQLACRNLCTCNVRADDDRVWARLLELAADPDPRVAAM